MQLPEGESWSAHCGAKGDRHYASAGEPRPILLKIRLAVTPAILKAQRADLSSS